MYGRGVSAITVKLDYSKVLSTRTDTAVLFHYRYRNHGTILARYRVSVPQFLRFDF